MRGNSFINDLRNNFTRQADSLNQLIAVNVLVFVVLNLIAVVLALFALRLGWYDTISRWLAVPAYLPRLLQKPWSPLSYMFVHSGFFHILFNMLWLYWMGKIFQEYLGNKKLVALYFLGGLAGAVTYILAFNLFPLFKSALPTADAVGASASVLAIVVGTATLLPDYSIRLFLFGNVPLKYLALVMVVLDLLSLSGNNAGGHFAHLGGAIFGFVYIKQLRAGNDLGAWFNRLVDWLATFLRPRSKRGKMRVSYKQQSTTANNRLNKSDSNQVPQEVIDRILDKIAQNGYDGLSKEEKEQLFRASKQ